MAGGAETTARANDINLPTEFMNVMELRAKVPDELTARPGVYSITVLSPSLAASDPNLNNTLLLVTFKSDKILWRK